MQTLSEQFKKWSKMAAAQEDTELAPSHEQNKKYMYTGSNYSCKTTAH